MRRTKIIATMGPASSGKDILRELLLAGVNVCRLNFSHGSHEDHAKTIQTIRELNDELGLYTSILADLQGPKIRIGEVENNGVELINGSILTITTKECIGTSDRVYITYPEFPRDVKKDELVMVDDGKLLLSVVETNGIDEVKLEVLHGGILSSKKGVNLPDTAISQPSLTEKDERDLDFALEHNVDWVGLSFVRSARDIIELKHKILSKNKHSRVIAKIEKPEAVDDLEDIIKETDAIMVARGDLGVEIPMQNVPLVQKKIVNMCLKYAKPVIIATQMMESMITNISPTRAEVNDVANAVMDGADAVMLSGETSVGKHPLAVIEAMSKIVTQIEENYDDLYMRVTEPEKNQERFITDSICFTATKMASRVDAKGIVTMTHSGYTAYKISSQRPRASVYVFSGNKRLLTILNLVWGVQTFYYDKMVSTDHTIADIKYLLKRQGYLQTGDLIINTASMPIEESGNTNMMKMSRID